MCYRPSGPETVQHGATVAFFSWIGLKISGFPQAARPAAPAMGRGSGLQRVWACGDKPGRETKRKDSGSVRMTRGVIGRVVLGVWLGCVTAAAAQLPPEIQMDRHLVRAISDVLPVSMKKIDRVKRRFVEQGLEAALDKRKAERSHTRKADGDFEANLVALSCSKPPPGHARWSLRLLADRMVALNYVDAISHETVRRVLKKTN